MFLIVGAETVPCPNCREKLKYYDRRKRGVILKDGCSRVYLIRRFKCIGCRKIHHELPDFMVPYKRYSAEVIESVVEHKDTDIPFEERTRKKIRAWYRAVVEHLRGIWRRHERRGFVTPLGIVGLVPLVIVAANSGNWPYHPFGRF